MPCRAARPPRKQTDFVFPSLPCLAETVLVVEYGEIEYAAGIFDPPQTVWGGAGALASNWMFSTLPNPAVDDKEGLVFVGKVVGGSSAINGMFFDRGSRYDFDAWTQVGSPEFDADENKWDWAGIFPSFKKVSNYLVGEG